MPLSAGDRLGPYEILSALGAGGMGEVYRASDTKLKRRVAIKILPPLFAADPDRLARLQREAEMLAVLNHPNIATIYGLEEAGGVKALVMELVEGEDLAQRLARGPLRIDEVLPIAKQLAEGLEAAHDAGIVHRDLKPANIKVRPDGTVKVLDFGLARPAPVDASHSRPGDLVTSPTITSPATLTLGTVILGTAAYMAPEQVRGHVADRRSDIWAFGVVVFEMITARRLFDGETISDTLASVLKTTPEWSRLPSSVPIRLRELLGWCLEKDPRRRLQAIGDARVQIERILSGDTGGVATIRTSVAPRWLRILPWAAAGALAASTIALLLRPQPDSPVPTTPVRVDAMLGSGVTLKTRSGGAEPLIALSRDGTLLAFVGQKGETDPWRIYLRRLDGLEAAPLAGTEGAGHPFFSPDGKSIGFVVGGRLKRISIGGGSALDIAPSPTNRGASWADDDVIVFTAARDEPMTRVAVAGGAPARIAPLAENEATQRWPQILPGARGVLFTGSRVANAGYNDASLVVQALPTGPRKTILTGGFHGRYVPSGHILYLHQGTLFARPFDVSRLEVTGPAQPVLEGVMSDTNTGSAQYAVSDTGTLAYVPGESAAEGVDIQWLDRDGGASPLRTARANWWNIRFAPDRRRLALQITDETDDIWIYEWARSVITPVTRGAGANTFPVWTPDGRRLAFASTRDSKSAPNLYWQLANDTGGAQRLTTSSNLQWPGSFDPTGRFLAFEEQHPQTRRDLMLLSLEGDDASGWKPGEVSVILNTAANERSPIISPDGRWLAYVSDESGRDEVYVRPFRGPGGRVQVSTDGGRGPVWSPTSREIFHGAADASQGQVMIAPYRIEGDALVVDKARAWPGARFQARGPNRMFDVHPDGTRLAFGPVIRPDDLSTRDRVTIIFNFFDEVRRRTRQ